ncbi:hypothetical protein KPSA3_00284 [Pseudomonas syringae pv. actinidiae]|uniref:Uncharacterized protein n=1 Tax=Pseudomonas syringae pv. actinidiae TaxID=103796 RepID=A0AAN4PZR0_PSESF|nr:hypothetical protein KPSA3_00284 [Pseudomonas syringae pv. actinidiae]
MGITCPRRCLPGRCALLYDRFAFLDLRHFALTFACSDD